MNRQERDSFVATTDQTQLAYGESACLETPPDLFAALHEEFHFDVDLTANEQNFLRPTWLGPGAMAHDALTKPWHTYGHSGFSNPPYGTFVGKILFKAAIEQTLGFTSVFLLPMRVNRAFKQYCLGCADEIRFVDERIRFWYLGKPKLNPKNQQHDPALFDSVIVVFRPRSKSQLNFGPRVSVWHWNAERLARIRRG